MYPYRCIVKLSTSPEVHVNAHNLADSCVNLHVFREFMYSKLATLQEAFLSLSFALRVEPNECILISKMYKAGRPLGNLVTGQP